MTGVAVFAEHGAFDGRVNVGVIEHDERRVATELKCQFFDAGGGTQTAVNGKYVETIEYFTKTSQSIGKSVEFSYSVLDGDWRHKGQKSTGGPLDECWTKRKLIEEKFGKK